MEANRDGGMHAGEFADGFGEYSENRMARQLTLSFRPMSVHYRGDRSGAGENGNRQQEKRIAGITVRKR